jgi:SAM-dependent methyltransferase
VNAPLVPLTPRRLTDIASVPDSEVRERWRLALGRDGRAPPALLSLLEDWSEFAGLDYPTMLARVLSAQEEIDQQWRENRPKGPRAVARFYDTTETLTPLLVWWHGLDLNPARCALAAEQVLRAVGARRVLDFGCGIGSTALLMANTGMEVILADVSRELLRLSAWRLERRGHTPQQQLNVLNTSLSSLAAGGVDGITAFDVFEHIPDPEPSLLELDRALAPGGVMCLNQVYVPEDDELQHYPRRGELLTWLHDRHYRLGRVMHVCWLAQKSPLPPAAHRIQGLLLRGRIAATLALEGRTGPIGRRLAFHIGRYGLR